MKFFFEDSSQSFEALRAAGYAAYGGADLGEVLVTCREIPEGDDEAWSSRWAATAARIESIGREALAGGHHVSAREALLRASNYYRCADFYRREDPDNDPESKRLAKASQDTFADAAVLLDTPAQRVDIPYEDTTLPGYVFFVDDSGATRPSVLFHGGFDSTLEEDYPAMAAAALRRGYNVITFDGPGQGRNIRKGMTFRPDWEAVVTPILDYAATVPEINPENLVLIGMSMGGYLAARAAAFEPRLAACVLYPGVWDMSEPLVQMAQLAASTPGGIDALTARDTGTRWAVRNGKWVFGAADLDEVVKISESYSLEGIAHQIRCPTLALDNENDQFLPGQPARVFDALTCPKEMISFREDEGAGEHCSEGALTLLHQRTFDWVDRLMAG